jgi:hypothetical protein
MQDPLYFGFLTALVLKCLSLHGDVLQPETLSLEISKMSRPKSETSRTVFSRRRTARPVS